MLQLKIVSYCQIIGQSIYRDLKQNNGGQELQGRKNEKLLFNCYLIVQFEFGKVKKKGSADEW